MKQEAGWSIQAGKLNPHHYFGITVANGMIGMVSDVNPMHIREVVLNGVFDRYQRGRVSNILKGINPFNLDIAVNDQMVDISSAKDFRQSLYMKRAAFFSSFIGHEKLEVTYRLRALRNLPYTGLVEVTLKAKEACKVTLFNNMIAPDHLREVKSFYSEIDRPHVRIPLMTTVANSPSGAHTLAASNSFIFQDGMEEPELIHEDWDFNRHLVKFNLSMKSGDEFRFGLVSSLCTTAHFSDPQNEAERLSIFAKLEGLDRLINRHEDEWKKLWKSDIELTGDEEVQKEIRSMLYHLYSFAREGSRLSISPVGLSGLGYNGHVFWDTELWMYPPLLVMHPDIAKSLLDYRFDRLEAAKANAYSHGFKGAMFPWESADDGTEQTPVWALTGPFQQHITACIGWAFWKYYQVTQDRTWLKEKGYVMLKEVATFWCSRVERKGPGKYEINNVIGANEFEENIDNNAFTNGIVIEVLQAAIKAAEILGEPWDPDWQDVAENIPILTFLDGTTKENATYNGAIIKQADVNLLAHPLQVVTDVEQIQKDLDYYQPRMSPDGPAMGLATLATLRAQIGEVEEAYRLFVESYRSNGVPPFGVLAECAGGKGVSPYFATGAGGALQTVLFGFAGLRITDTGIDMKHPRIPNAWNRLSVKLGYKSRHEAETNKER